MAKQDGRAIFNTSVSFQLAEEGLTHQSQMPDVPPPEEVESDIQRLEQLAIKNPGMTMPPILSVIERRTVNPRDRFNPQATEPVQHIWFRVPGPLGDDLARQQTLLAYISDFGLLGTALYPHPVAPHTKGLQEASLDHALWFHRPFRIDDYLLYSLDSPNASGGRGFSRGSFYTRDGVLVASSAQEALLRQIPVS